jgi:molybdenum cofactor cytidylyltransferase
VVNAERPAAAVVPAAGRGERFGSRKLLATVDGVPLIGRTVRSLLDGGVDRVVVVVAPPQASQSPTAADAPILADPRVTLVVNPDPDRGMLFSILAGLSVADGDPVLVLPGDMPFVRPATVSAVIAAARRHDALVSPRFEGRRGHPIAMPARIAAAVFGGPAARDFSAALEPYKKERLELDVDDPGVLRDVDTPGDLPPRASGIHWDS